MTLLEARNQILTIGGSINIPLTSCLTCLDLTKQVNLLLNDISKAAESYHNKQEVNCTVTLPFSEVS